MREVFHQAYSFDGFTLDLTRGALLRGEDEIRLRPKSYATLKYLVENNGRLISKDELVEAVWVDTAVTDNSLVQCLKEVRVALGDRDQRYIKTVPRRGYIFNEKLKPDYGNVLYFEDVEEARVLIHQRTEVDGETVKTEKTTTEGGIANANARLWSGRVVVPAVAVFLVFLAYYVVSRDPSSNQQVTTVASVRSLAILPFRSLNGDEGDNYLGLGIADTLIARLSKTNDVVIRPTSAIQRYTFHETDTLAVAREQRVDAVLEGSIQKLGNRMRVTARLVSVPDGVTFWSFKSDESFDDVFTLQDVVSEKVARALAIESYGDERAQKSKRYTENVEAYQLYLKGVFLRDQLTEDSLKRSVESFQKAIELDPGYALAYSGQASAYSPLAYLGHIPVKEAEARNRALVTRALELDDSLAEAHAAYGELKLFVDWDWEGAESEFKRALELKPREQLALLLYPKVLIIQGRPDEAIAMSKALLEIDPLSPRAGMALGRMYHLVGRNDEAIEQMKATRELFPQYHLIYFGPVYEQKEMYAEAVDGYLDTEARWGLPSEKISVLRGAYSASGWKGYWQKRLELMKESAKHTPTPPIYFAEVYAKLGENKMAIDWLKKAYDERDMSLVMLSVDPVWKSLHLEPEFQELLHRMRLSG